MMRLPWFEYRAVSSAEEASRVLAGEGAQAMLVAGGTDLLPNMKRRQQTPRVLVSVRDVAAMRKFSDDGAVSLGASLSLTDLVGNATVRERYRGLWQAAAQVATPHLRNMGTIGGNLCLDTRCTYYDQNEEWRKAIDYCLKRDGQTCWVATASKRCVAASSTDTAPALIAIGASVRLVSAEGERDIPVADLYRNDGIDYLSRRPDEVLTEVLLPADTRWRSTYWKLRRRGSFDFPVLGVAAAIRFAPDGSVEDARVALGAVASRPFLVADATTALVGRKLDDDTIAEAAAAVASRAKPLDNTDMDLYWRKQVVDDFAGYALRELRGDDLSAIRFSVARQALAA
ncbi:MAG: FAD binding domain-containing protein [Burkholderiaceae bacterium]|nr:FAD binding domain-containing protein [Burkholderiaceae bacterium]